MDCVYPSTWRLCRATAAAWRNLLGVRGSRRIAHPSNTESPTDRRAVNLVGGEVVNVDVHDFPPQEVDKYVKYPVVEYVRRKLARLSDEEIMNGALDNIKFGSVRTR